MSKSGCARIGTAICAFSGLVFSALLAKRASRSQKCIPLHFYQYVCDVVHVPPCCLAISKRLYLLFFMIARHKAEHAAHCECIGNTGTGCTVRSALSVFPHKARCRQCGSLATCRRTSPTLPSKTGSTSGLVNIGESII